jgi:hypothetical protein
MGLGRTVTYTGAAQNAFFSVEKRTVAQRVQCVLGAQFATVTARKATFGSMNMLLGNVQPLGIMTPPAGQRASLKKNRRPNTGAIVDGIFFYIENYAAGHRP